MGLAIWLRLRRRDPKPSPIPEAVRQLHEQADALNRLVDELRRANNIREHNA